jgi:hypothetical protein
VQRIVEVRAWGQVLQSSMTGSLAVAVPMAVVPAGAQTAPKGEPLAGVLEGTRAGVTGTPACCINGQLLSGAQPLKRFVQIIEEELAWAR